MQETLQLLLNHGRMIWRFRWLALAAGAVLCVIGWFTVLLQPNQYEVETKVFLDTRTMLQPVLRGLAVDTNLRQESLDMMRRTLLTRPNLETVARATDLDLEAETPEDFERLINGLGRGIEVSGTRRDNIFVISYTHTDPRLATRVVESLLNIFVERSLGESRKDTTATRQFLDAQIKEYEARLESAEERLKEFKQRNVGMMPRDGQGYYQRLQSAQGELAAVELALREAQNRRNELRRQVEGVGILFEPIIPVNQVADAVSHPLDGRIDSLERRLDDLLLQYTEQHPDVIGTRRVLEQLEEQRAADLAEREPVVAAPVETPSQIQNPVYQELKLALGTAEAEVAALQTRAEEYERRVEELANLVDTVPKVEAEFTRLNRDYEINKRNYEELVKRREALKLSDDAVQTTDDVQFNIIEPPRVPLVPVSPNRPALSAGALVAGLGAGLGLAWLVAQLRPAFYTRDELAETVQLPVLGTVSRMWTRREALRRQMEVVSFGVGCLVLIGLFGGVLAIESLDPDLPNKLNERLGDVAGRLSGFADRLL